MIVAEPGGDRRQALGRWGEERAEALLCEAGFRILERRWRRRVGEIDLIAERGELLIFVEVKTRRGTGYGGPAESVTRLRRRRMARAALSYLAFKGWLDRVCRFDVIEVVATGRRPPRLRHLEDAFRPEQP